MLSSTPTVISYSELSDWQASRSGQLIRQKTRSTAIAPPLLEEVPLKKGPMAIRPPFARQRTPELSLRQVPTVKYNIIGLVLLIAGCANLIPFLPVI